ncbi:nonribosomal peptide synthetase 12 [Marasmius fiardii PR-910]|nr:nonribosomal peptide synthetase 12 [Marasmius fiardii PR-910]
MHPTNDLFNGLSTEDYDAFFQLGQGVTLSVPFPCVHHAFHHHATLHPSNIAVENFGERITYAELDRQSSHLASHLQTLGIVRGSRVCLLVERSIEMVIGILSILKAGGGYIPLDGNVVPDKTLQHILKDAKPGAILVMHQFKNRVPNTNLPVICIEDALSGANSIDGIPPNPHSNSSAEDTVYIIYTSGTTGVPKGVDVKHGNVTNLVCLSPGNLGLAPGRRVSQLMNISFDMAQWEILASLGNGATLCLRGKDSKQWKAVMKTVQVIIATPSMLVSHSPADYPNVEVVAVAGEPCPISVADSWGASAQFYNCCGPTEVTIVNTMHLHTPGSPLSIGKPTPNNRVYILDENMKPVPIGKQGIMWAGGAGVTRGYLNPSEKASKHYQRDPFADDGSLMFNTGDLGCWMLHGGLEVHGRTDDQIKVKGFRVELDGVATAMESCPGVDVAVALLIDGNLWGFVTPGSTQQETVIAHLSKAQPYYAIPTRILAIDEFPKTINGKNDKQALQQLVLNKIEMEKMGAIIPAADLSLQKKSLVSVQPSLPMSYTPPQDSHIPARDKLQAKDSHDFSATSCISEYTNECWEGYEHDNLPDKTQGHYLRNLRHQIFTLYRRLFGIVFIVNMAILIWIGVKGASIPKIGEIVVANLFCAILMRQDYVINLFFNVFCAVPPSWPLSIRRVCARVYHIGGLHSGCAISGVIWLCVLTARATKDVVEGAQTSIPTLVVSWVILVFLFGIVIFAHPSLRLKRHDFFERVHRFMGWAAAVLVWAQVILLINDYKGPNQTLGKALRTSPSFWLVVIFTGSLILPWLRLRKVNVRAEALSNHAIRLYFDYGITPVAGSFVRLSKSPLLEWHGFATIPEPGKTGYSLVISRAGDWTSKQISEPPTQVWIRGVPTCGVLRIVPLFNRLVFVATGSGIGPCAPCILEQRVPIRLLWTSPNVRQTFGDKLVDELLEKSPGAVIYDTRKHGKPDMVKLTYRLVREFNAEAVCVISNQKLTRKVVYGLMSRGVPAFGAIWDS